SLDQPPHVVIYDVRRQRWVGEPPARPGPAPELRTFTARDGLGLSGWLYRADPGAGPGPTVVHLHGGPEGQSRPGYDDIARRMLDEGVNYFLPNVRGSTGSGRSFGHADDRYGRFIGIDDVEDSLLHLVEAGIADPDRAVVSGRSYGGYLVNATLVRHAGRWRGGIAACGMSDLRTFYRDTEPWIAAAAYPKYGNPLHERELLAEASPLRRFDAIDVPVLFVHGARDTNVPVSETEQAAEALREREVPVDVLLFSDEGHEFVKLSNRQLLGGRVVEFCRRVFDDRTRDQGGHLRGGRPRGAARGLAAAHPHAPGTVLRGARDHRVRRRRAPRTLARAGPVPTGDRAVVRRPARRRRGPRGPGGTACGHRRAAHGRGERARLRLPERGRRAHVRARRPHRHAPRRGRSARREPATPPGASDLPTRRGDHARRRQG